MKLAIVIVHYNTSSDLARCLESLTVYPPTCEHTVAVVDNASTDPGLPAVQQRFPAVRWLLNAENAGYARGGNQGLASVPAEYYLLLNPDTMAQPGAVDALLEFADSHPKAGIVGPQLLNDDGTLQESCRRFYTFTTLLLRRTFLGKLFRRSSVVDRHLMRDFDHRTARPVDWVLGGCLLVRRAAMERTGPMDERFFLYFEDVDWCYRMWQAGWEVQYTPTAHFVHRHRRESAKGAFHKSFWRHLGSLISFYEKWGLLVYMVKKWRRPLSVLLLWALDMVALVTAFGGAYLLRKIGDSLFTESLYPWSEYRPLLGFALLLVTVTFLLGGRYRMSRARATGNATALLRQVGIVTLLLLASTYLSHQQVYSRAVLLLFIPLFAVTTLLGEGLFRAVQRRMERGYLSLERTLLVGDPVELQAWLDGTPDPRHLGIDPVGYVCEPATGDRDAQPPLARGEVPWLCDWQGMLPVVERYRISQVVFWQQPGFEPADRLMLARLRRRRIRLRWRVDEAWLVAAGARAEAFGPQVSAVLEPDAFSLARLIANRLLSAGFGCLLLLVTGAPYAGLRLLRRGSAWRSIECVDAWGEPIVVRCACDRRGRVLPLWWQWPLARALLGGRLSLIGSRLNVAAPGETNQPEMAREFWRGEPPACGLTGRWAAAIDDSESTPADADGQKPDAPGREPFSFAAFCVMIGKMVTVLLLDPGGIRRATPGSLSSPPEISESPSQREVR